MVESRIKEMYLRRQDRNAQHLLLDRLSTSLVWDTKAGQEDRQEQQRDDSVQYISTEDALKVALTKTVSADFSAALAYSRAYYELWLGRSLPEILASLSVLYPNTKITEIELYNYRERLRRHYVAGRIGWEPDDGESIKRRRKNEKAALFYEKHEGVGHKERKGALYE